MISLSTTDAVKLVRKNFDEQGLNDSVMAIEGDVDATEFADIVIKTLPEAINAIHLEAPVQLLDGEHLSQTDLGKVKTDGDVLILSLGNFLRMLSLQTVDSDYVVSDVVDEYSMEGRMQLNPYTRGSSDNPKVVLCQGRTDGESVLKYYALDRRFQTGYESTAIKRFEYLKRYKYASTTTTYNVAENVFDNVIYRLTGMVLAIYGSEKASYFVNLSSFNAPVVTEQ